MHLSIEGVGRERNSGIRRQDGFRTSRVYEVYENICTGQGSDSLSLRRVRDLLKEHAFLDIIEQSKHSGGSAEGSYTKHQLLEDPQVVRDVLKRDSSPPAD